MTTRENLLKPKGRLRTNNREVTHFDDPLFQHIQEYTLLASGGNHRGSKVDVYYYRKDGSFIKADKQIQFFSGETIIPKGADYFRAVFEAPSTKGVQVERMTMAISKNVTIIEF